MVGSESSALIGNRSVGVTCPAKNSHHGGHSLIAGDSCWEIVLQPSIRFVFQPGIAASQQTGSSPQVSCKRSTPIWDRVTERRGSHRIVRRLVVVFFYSSLSPS